MYGVRAFENKEGFTNAAGAPLPVYYSFHCLNAILSPALLNVIENLMNIYYLYLAHVSSSSAAPLVGFMSVVMTLSKVAIYLAQEYFCDYCSIGHNDLKTLIQMWIIPNACVP